MAATYDLTGQRFGKLVALERIERPDRRTWWRLACDCGNETFAFTGNLRAGAKIACGCVQPVNQKHSGSGTRLYGIWGGMKSRCQNKNKLAYVDYGGRGIRICTDWQQFLPFRDWALVNGYADNLQIDRIDNDGHYEPANCRWVTQSANMLNKRQTGPIGLRYTMKEIRFALDAAGIAHNLLLPYLPKKRRYR